MVFSVIAAITITGFIGIGPVLMGGDTCSCSGEESESVSKCDVHKIQERMRRKELPMELKVEVEGKLYAVPENVRMVTPQSAPSLPRKWWERLTRGVKDADPSVEATDASLTKINRTTDDDSSSTRDGDDNNAKGLAVQKDMCSAGEHSCQICFDANHSTVMLPCGHGGVCWDCGLQIYALTEECPICRTNIELLVPLDGEKIRYQDEDVFVSSATACAKDGRPLVTFSTSDRAALLSDESSAAAVVRW